MGIKTFRILMNDYPYEFELERIKERIKESAATTIGLQLPEGLKRVATEIALELYHATGAEVIISGHSCYGACDIDEKLEREVDLLFHFGHTETFPFYKREPVVKGKNKRKVFFIELRSSVDVKPVVEKAAVEITGARIGLVTTVQHVHRLEEAKKVLARMGKDALVGKSRGLKYAGQVLGCEFSSARVPCDEIMFVGSGTFHPVGIALYTGKRVIAADPFSMQISIVEAEEQRKKRYLAIARTLDAKSFGIIMSTKSGQFNLDKAISVCRKADAKGLNAFLIAMDDITEVSLLGFKVDAYVNTACPRLAEDFDKLSVLSAEEFEVVLGERDWGDIF